jgi:hypothetical protein
MRPSFFPVALIAFLIPTAAEASYVDGGKLQELLAVAAEAEQGHSKGVEDAYGSGFVIGYIAGVADTYNGLLLCRTPEVPLRQIVAVVKQYVDEHPADRSRPAEWIVLKALSSAFPCPQ